MRQFLLKINPRSPSYIKHRVCRKVPRNLVVFFSPDDYWIIVQDGGPSLGISLRLFRRNKGVKFTEQKDADIDGKAERLALKQNGFPAQEILDHRYAKVLAWSRDSTCVLIALSDHGGTREQAISALARRRGRGS